MDIATHMKPSHALDECCRRNIENFAKLGEVLRERCTSHLRKILRGAGSTEALRVWSAQVKAGNRIGSDDPRFHFSTGMAVRNALRDVAPDTELPALRQPGGDFTSNWDDYYYGALHAAVSEELGNG